MKTPKTHLTVFALAIFFLALSSPAALASNIVIGHQTEPAVPGLYLTSSYTNDVACIQAALDNSKSGDTITIREGDYYITKQIYQKGKSLNIIGEGKVTLHLQTPEGENNGLCLVGSIVTDQSLSADALKGSSQVKLASASSVRAGDLISIWNNVKWCPLDYPNQLTGETYLVQSVNGNTVTLTEPLLRDYRTAQASKSQIYRPIEVHISGLTILDSGATTTHAAIYIDYCKDCTVTGCTVKDSGFAAISYYNGYNVSVSNCKIYNSLLDGSGYGVAIWSGTAWASVTDNYIENCRHDVTCNSDGLIWLTRNVTISNNTLIGGSINGANVVDSHADTLSWTVTNNRIYPKLPYFFAISDGAQQSVISGNKIYGGYGGINVRGSVDNTVEIIKDNSFQDLKGCIYQGGAQGKGNTLIIKNNFQTGSTGEYGIRFPDSGSFQNIVISGNTFENLSSRGIHELFMTNGVNLDISDNSFRNIKSEGIFIDGNSFTNGVVKIQNNRLINVNPSNSNNGVVTKNIQNALVSGNGENPGSQTPQVPIAAFSASPGSGNAPLSIAFADTSTGSPTTWNWSFGDGTTSTQQNPTHTYSTVGNYTVALTATNAAGSNTVTKSSYIIVTAPVQATAQKPVASFTTNVTSGNAPLSIAFTGTSKGSPTTWNWSFGDGTTSTQQNPTHTYSSAGNYSIKLTAANSAGSSMVTKYLVRKAGTRSMQLQ